jgi:hypothetical protein
MDAVGRILRIPRVGSQSAVNVLPHSTDEASRRAALLLGRKPPVFSLVVPCLPGAAPVSERRTTFSTGC